METKTVTIHCAYSDNGIDISVAIRESFRFFVQKELGVLTPVPQHHTAQ